MHLALVGVRTLLDFSHHAADAHRRAGAARGLEVPTRLDADQDPELEIWGARRKGDLLEALTDRKLRFSVDAIGEREPRPSRSRDEAAAPPGARLRAID